MNRLAISREYLAELKNEIGYGAAVHLAVGETTQMLVTFPGHQEIDDSKAVEVNFEAKDFKNAQMYENATKSQIVEFVQDFAERAINDESDQRGSEEPQDEIVESEGNEIIEQ